MLCSGAAAGGSGGSGSPGQPEPEPEQGESGTGDEQDPTCACCMNDIEDEELQALGKSYHPECFRWADRVARRSGAEWGVTREGRRRDGVGSDERGWGRSD